MDNSKKVIIACICLCGLVNYVGSTLTTFTTTRRPPPQAVDVDSKSLMRAGRMSYGGFRKVVTKKIPKAQKEYGGCRRRVIRRFIGDSERNCTSLRPYPIAWCEGVCLPEGKFDKKHPLMRFKEYLKKNSKSYECVADRVVRRKVEIYCHDDELLHVYRINVIKTCKCKQVENEVSNTDEEDEVDKAQSIENSAISISQQAKRFSHRLHNLQNKLRKVQ
ncbi:uncharacterized protein [Clytia hemisphaerica]|uniref:Uncharacterized protein n=1 Tax=Clytia hemisphaerica TaxID=252671 RepID=A0A7M5WKB6_9CNID